MPHRVPAVVDFARVAGRLRTSEQVLDGTDKIAKLWNMSAHSIWQITRPVRHEEVWRPGCDCFLHRDVPHDFVPRIQSVYRSLGYSFFLIEARRHTNPFTVAEALQRAKIMRPHNTWNFKFISEYGIGDGLICPHRRWAFFYTSPKLLALSALDRSLLAWAAQIAMGRIELMVRRRRVRDGFVQLTPRERSVLQIYADDRRVPEVAKSLGVKQSTVRDHLQTIRRKFKARSAHRAVLLAYRQGSIEVVL